MILMKLQKSLERSLCFPRRKNSIFSTQIIKEKKATYIQSPKNNKFNTKFNDTKKNNIFAGDWTQNALPCTIEASILSGKKAIESL